MFMFDFPKSSIAEVSHCLSFLKWGNLRLMSKQLKPSVSNCSSKLFELRLTDLARPWLRRKVAEAIRDRRFGFNRRWQFVKNVHVVSVGIIVIERLRPVSLLSWRPFKDFVSFFWKINCIRFISTCNKTYFIIEATKKSVHFCSCRTGTGVTRCWVDQLSRNLDLKILENCLAVVNILLYFFSFSFVMLSLFGRDLQLFRDTKFLPLFTGVKKFIKFIGMLTPEHIKKNWIFVK